MLKLKLEKAKEEMEKKRLERREKIKARLEQSKERKHKNTQRVDPLVKKYLEHPYTHEKLEKQYQESVVLPELQNKQKYLEELKDYYKPLSHSAIMSHKHSYENLKRVKENELRAKRERSYHSKFGFENAI